MAGPGGAARSQQTAIAPSSLDEAAGHVQRPAHVLPCLLAGAAFDGGHDQAGPLRRAANPKRRDRAPARAAAPNRSGRPRRA